MTHPDTLVHEPDSIESRSRDATATGAQAFARLLSLAEQCCIDSERTAEHWCSG